MSYVRIGADSDVYLYGDGMYLNLHVAQNRGHRGEVPYPSTGATKEEWVEWMRDVVPLSHPETGKDYHFRSYAKCIAKLEELRESGLRVPEYPFTRLHDEAKNGDAYS